MTYVPEIALMEAPLITVTQEADSTETIAKLREQLTQAELAFNEEIRRTEAARQRHYADIALISEKLIEEANDRGWCAEYDTVVDELNEELNVKIDVREREFTVEVAVTLTIRVSARDADSAREAASDIAADAEEACDNITGVISTFQSSYDYEVEESD